MNYPVSTLDSLGAQQIPIEKEPYYNDEPPSITAKDYFGNIIQSNDRVFELTFKMYDTNEELQSVMIYTVTEIVTQSTISELIDKFKGENLIFIEHLGLGKEIYGG